jgi:hypothetical protein
MKKKNRRQFNPLDKLRILHQLHGVVSVRRLPSRLRTPLDHESASVSLDIGVHKEYRLPSEPPERGDVVFLDNTPQPMMAMRGLED